jgi:hypothetical protein
MKNIPSKVHVLPPLWLWWPCKSVISFRLLREANSQDQGKQLLSLSRHSVCESTNRSCTALPGNLYWRTVSLKNISRFSLVETKALVGSEDRLFVLMKWTVSIVGRRQRFLRGLYWAVVNQPLDPMHRVLTQNCHSKARHCLFAAMSWTFTFSMSYIG